MYISSKKNYINVTSFIRFLHLIISFPILEWWDNFSLNCLKSTESIWLPLVIDGTNISLNLALDLCCLICPQCQTQPLYTRPHQNQCVSLLCRTIYKALFNSQSREIIRDDISFTFGVGRWTRRAQGILGDWFHLWVGDASSLVIVLGGGGCAVSQIIKIPCWHSVLNT